MRGRKHPLEIFAEGGRTFVTLGDARARAHASASRAKAVSGAAEKESTEPASHRDGVSVAAGDAPRERRRLLRRSMGALRSGGMRRWTRSLTLGRVAGILGGLVVLVGGAYALRLLPGALRSTSGDPRLSAETGRSGNWREEGIPDVPGRDGEGDDPDSRAEGGAAPKPDGAKPHGESLERQPQTGSGAAPSAKESWIVAASVKWKADEAARDARTCFEHEERQLRAKLGPALDGVTVQTIFPSRSRTELLLRIGPMARADDPALVRLLDRVRGLGGPFKDAVIRDFAPARKQ